MTNGNTYGAVSPYGLPFGYWTNWTGDRLVVTNLGQLNTNFPSFAANYLLPITNMAYISTYNLTLDALFSHPTNDYYILDLFTTALDDDMSRGQLSVNQANLGAWSAVLSGVDVLRDASDDTVIQPAGAYLATAPTPVAQIVYGINRARSITNWFPLQTFNRLGDILRVPELTTNSPFLNPTAMNIQSKPNITDEVVERIPQQILGLLKGGELPRFIVYAYGQTLKPANASLLTAPSAIGLPASALGICTNYQVTAETATRAVVRIEGGPLNPHAVIENMNVLPPD